MDAWSFSLPAGYACPMKNWSDESYICHGCYAMINRYNMPNVLRAQTIRFMWTKECLKTLKGRVVWANMMIKDIHDNVDNGFFRGHDSGDFFHPEYVNMWYYVCRSLSNIQFWFPTRCYNHSKSFNLKWEISLTQLNSLPNVVVRPSALKWNDPSPQIEYLSKGTTVVSDKNNHINICPKTLNGGSCLSNNCRSCWSNKKEIAYLVHGYMGRSAQPNSRTKNIINKRTEIYNLTIKGKKYAKS